MFFIPINAVNGRDGNGFCGFKFKDRKMLIFTTTADGRTGRGDSQSKDYPHVMLFLSSQVETKGFYFQLDMDYYHYSEAKGDAWFRQFEGGSWRDGASKPPKVKIDNPRPVVDHVRAIFTKFESQLKIAINPGEAGAHLVFDPDTGFVDPDFMR